MTQRPAPDNLCTGLPVPLLCTPKLSLLASFRNSALPVITKLATRLPFFYLLNTSQILSSGFQDFPDHLRNAAPRDPPKMQIRSGFCFGCFLHSSEWLWGTSGWARVPAEQGAFCCGSQRFPCFIFCHVHTGSCFHVPYLLG